MASRSWRKRRVQHRSLLLFLISAAAFSVTVAAAVWCKFHFKQTRDAQGGANSATFNKDIAPIIFNHCAICHCPGGPGPFALISYEDVSKRAADILDVTARRYMPPWLPEHGYGDLAGERRLSMDQLRLIQKWVAEGAVEGRPADLPPLPSPSGDWGLGQPDLVVTMPRVYTLAAEGRDVYRNFVVPVPIEARRYVRGIEFHPGNPKIVHHAFVKVDRTGQSRRLEAAEAQPGFPGMNAPAEMPDGHFLGWQPGRVPKMGPEGLPWRLDPGNDLILQMHLNPSGKPETLQSSVGLYFASQPATNVCYKIALASFAVDIPAGATNYVVEDSYVLPVDVDVLGVLPHAHYLAREMAGWATRPDGTRAWLIWIKQWDFKWQGDYSYAKPVFLPKGSRLSMRFTYDNSANNPRNPNHPPQRVVYGPQSKDEMAELWLQLLPRHREELTRLAEDFNLKNARAFREGDEATLRRDPNNAAAHTDLGMALMEESKPEEAESHFKAAILSQPDYSLAHYDYGLLLRHQSRMPEARTQFLEVVRLDPNNFKAHGNLGWIAVEQADLQSAQTEFEAALRLNPDDALSREGLAQVIKAQRGGQ